MAYCLLLKPLSFPPQLFSTRFAIKGGCSTDRLSYSKEKEFITADEVSNKMNVGGHINYHMRTIGGHFNRSKYRKCYSANSEVPAAEDYNLMNVWKQLTPSLKVLLAFTRPYACFGAVYAVVSTALIATENFSDISLPFLIALLKVAAVSGCICSYGNGINDIFDIEIDKVNKPHFPLASGEMSIKTAIAIVSAFAVMAFTIAFTVGSRPLFWGTLIGFFLTSAYSVNLPFLRWKKHALTAALTILAQRAIVLPISTFLHMQTFVLGRRANISRTMIFGTIVVSVFSAVIGLFKDIPDIEGDKKFAIRSLAASLGQKKVFWICVYLLEMVFTLAIVFGATSSRPWSKYITILGHAVLALILWKQANSVDLKNKSAIQSFYMLIWKLLYAEYSILPLMR